MRKLIGYSRNGKKVTFDPVHSHAATHIEDTPELPELVKELLQDIDLEGSLVKFTQDMKRNIGESDLVENDSDDEIIWAKRKNRDVFTPFNKTKGPQPSPFLSVSFKRLEDGSYDLDSAWIGTSDLPAFPGDVEESEESIPYWTRHSLTWGRQEIQTNTLTTICPWR